MSVFGRIFGWAGSDTSLRAEAPWEHIFHQKKQTSLRRVLEFTGHSIDDVINDSMARGRVRLYFKVDRAVERELKEEERGRAAREAVRMKAFETA
jgi:hypothetical protein